VALGWDRKALHDPVGAELGKQVNLTEISLITDQVCPRHVQPVVVIEAKRSYIVHWNVNSAGDPVGAFLDQLAEQQMIRDKDLARAVHCDPGGPLKAYAIIGAVHGAIGPG